MTILLAGASGRLGKEILSVLNESQCQYKILDRKDMASLACLKTCLTEPCVLLDVTLPDGTVTLAETLLKLPEEDQSKLKGFVIGATGHTSDQECFVTKVSKRIPVCYVSNFSRGIYLLEQMLGAVTSSGQTVATLARSLGFDVSMWESHHLKKIDHPSGTAKTLAQKGEIPFDRISSSRVGSVIGEHAILMSSDSEELRLTHVAHSRKLFALGAVKICQNVLKLPRRPGIYDKSEFF